MDTKMKRALNRVCSKIRKSFNCREILHQRYENFYITCATSDVLVSRNKKKLGMTKDTRINHFYAFTPKRYFFDCQIYPANNCLAISKCEHFRHEHTNSFPLSFRINGKKSKKSHFSLQEKRPIFVAKGLNTLKAWLPRETFPPRR